MSAVLGLIYSIKKINLDLIFCNKLKSDVMYVI